VPPSDDNNRVNSTLASQIQAAGEPALATAKNAGRWHAAWRPGSGQGANRRRLSLDGLRLAGLGGITVTLVALCTHQFFWQQERHRTRQAADQALVLVEKKLDQLDQEMTRLQSEPGFVFQGGVCTEAVTHALVRASLASSTAQRFAIGERSTDQACHPEGRGLAFAAPPAATSALMLSSTHEISVRLTAARADAGGQVIAALLDKRAFDLLADTGALHGAAGQIRLSLISGTGHRLTSLNGAPPHALALDGLTHRALSSRHGVMVDAEVLPSSGTVSPWLFVWRQVLLAVLGAVLLLLAGLAFFWWRTLLRAELPHRIEKALRKRQFEPYVQPIVDLATGRCAGAEILMRWAHPERGILAPGEFIEEAERCGLILGMSDLVMARAAHRLAPLAAAHPELYFSFNITPAQLRQPLFAQQLATLFHAQTLPRDQVLLELTERDFVDTNGVQTLQTLRGQGWRIAIDDFGTGQSSLASLEQLPIDRIKIDRAFVSTIGEDTVNRPVLDAIISLGQQLNVRLIAEGIETRAQWDYLAARGVQYAQGYLMAKPMPIDAFADWLRAQTHNAAAASAQPAPQQAHAEPVLDAQAQQLLQHMRTPGGLDIRDRIYHLRSYPQCFVGREAVDWLVKHQGISRLQALSLGQRLAALGLIAHVRNEHDFADADLFYRLSSPAGPVTSATATAVADDLRSAIRGLQGVVQRDHVHGLLRHRHCTTGRDIVSWVVQRYHIPRSTATQWAAQLMRKGALRHVFDDQPFRDDGSFYRFS
jgi:EAL domain-containing protein (putative c-di-GMP-specific phosphodiesterase class I)